MPQLFVGMLIGLLLGITIMIIDRVVAARSRRDEEQYIRTLAHHEAERVLERVGLTEAQTDRIRQLAQEEIMTHDDLQRQMNTSPANWQVFS